MMLMLLFRRATSFLLILPSVLSAAAAATATGGADAGELTKSSKTPKGTKTHNDGKLGKKQKRDKKSPSNAPSLRPSVSSAPTATASKNPFYPPFGATLSFTLEFSEPLRVSNQCSAEDNPNLFNAAFEHGNLSYCWVGTKLKGCFAFDANEDFDVSILIFTDTTVAGQPEGAINIVPKGCSTYPPEKTCGLLRPESIFLKLDVDETREVVVTEMDLQLTVAEEYDGGCVPIEGRTVPNAKF